MNTKINFLTTNEPGFIEVEMLVFPSFNDGKIYFFDYEHEVFWSSIDQVGDFKKAKDFNLKMQSRPATFMEICDNNLYRHIKGIKVYEGYGKTLKTTYIKF